MILHYGSSVHLFTLAVCAVFIVVIYETMKNRSDGSKNNLLLIVAAVNVVQHLFKHILYPHLRGTNFGITNTAYNVCAALILLMPFSLLSKRKFFKIFLSYAGTAAGFSALLLPSWFAGKTILQWEYLRFYVCHVLLILTALPPILWGTRRPRHSDFLKPAPLFLLLLCAILANNVIVPCTERGFVPEKLYETLYEMNPLWMMHPADIHPVLLKILTDMTPSFFLASEAHPYYAPVLWYAIPIWVLVTLAAFILFAIADRKNFIADFKSLFPFLFRRVRNKKKTDIKKFL